METIVSQLPYKERDVCNVYLMGSRLWGNAREDSDYDLLVVLRTRPSDATYHSPRINATLIDADTFKQRLADHEYMETIASYVSDEYVFKQTLPLKRPQFDRAKWCERVEYRLQRSLAYADKCERKGNAERAWKTRWLCLSYLVLGTQVANRHDESAPTTIDAAEVERRYPKADEMTRERFEPLLAELLEAFHVSCARMIKTR